MGTGGAKGTALSCPARFFVNFVVGQGPGADVAFHFNPRFDGWDKVVFNSQQDGKWGNEEKKRSMPFRKGAAFELVIMVLPEHYKVRSSGRRRRGGSSPASPPPPLLPSFLPRPPLLLPPLPLLPEAPPFLPPLPSFLSFFSSPVSPPYLIFFSSFPVD